MYNECKILARMYRRDKEIHTVRKTVKIEMFHDYFHFPPVK